MLHSWVAVRRPRTTEGSGRDLTIADVTEYLPSWGGLDRPLIDQTGLTGECDFTIKWRPDPESLAEPGRTIILKNGAARPSDSEPGGYGPSFMQALRDQLGLRLVSVKAPVKTLVIDHVEPPSAN